MVKYFPFSRFCPVAPPVLLAAVTPSVTLTLYLPIFVLDVVGVVACADGVDGLERLSVTTTLGFDDVVVVVVVVVVLWPFAIKYENNTTLTKTPRLESRLIIII